jgi:Inositol 1,4,5-trisphosphate/ryanodine receptor
LLLFIICVCLSPWLRYITPKFRIKSEGDEVNSGDFIVLRSVKYKGKQLTTTLLSADCERLEHLVGTEKNTHMPNGWKLCLVLPHGLEAEAIKLAAIFGGDYIRLRHLQVRGIFFLFTYVISIF